MLTTELSTRDSQAVKMYRQIFPEHGYMSDETVISIINRIRADQDYAASWLNANLGRIEKENLKSMIGDIAN